MTMKIWIAAAFACSALALSACGGQCEAAAAPAAHPDKVVSRGFQRRVCPLCIFRLERQCRSVSMWI